MSPTASGRRSCWSRGSSGMGRRLQRRALRWFVRWVDRSSDERLERVMGGRIGRRIIRTVKRAMRQRFNAEKAGDLEAVVEFWITGRRNGRSENWQGGDRGGAVSGPA